MEIEYNKKDVVKSPKVKVAPKINPIPEGVEVYEKRGMWHVKGDDRGTHIFKTKQEAIEWLTK